MYLKLYLNSHVRLHVIITDPRLTITLHIDGEQQGLRLQHLRAAASGRYSDGVNLIDF